MREFRCHPMVIILLKEETWWAPHSRSRLWNYYDASPCPVRVDPSMEPGAWEFTKDGKVTDSGNTERPEPHEL